MLCWFSEQPLTPGAKYAIKHTSNGPGAGEGPAVPARREHAAPRRARDLDLRSTRSAGSPCARRSRSSTTYRRNRATGWFILVDEATNDTVAAGMIV